MTTHFAGEAAEKRALARDPPGPSGEGRTGRTRPQRHPPLAEHVGLPKVRGHERRQRRGNARTRLRPVDSVSLQYREKPTPPARGLWEPDCAFALLSFLEERGKPFSYAFTYILLANFFIQLLETNILKKCRKRREEGRSGKALS